jgi:hypothetical protein
VSAVLIAETSYLILDIVYMESDNPHVISSGEFQFAFSETFLLSFIPDC